MFRFEKTQIREGRYKHNRDNPSFSSSLLDQICRSIDDNDGVAAGTKHEESLKFCRETMQKKACLVGERMENKVPDKKISDRIFFSSSSSSSGSSYGGFSSSDTESMYGWKTKAPCFVPSRHKPVGTSVLAPPGKPLFYEQRQFHVVDDHAPKSSSAVKIHGDLKKTKQPVSPGSRLASFIYSLFTSGNNNPKKTNNPNSTIQHDDEVSTASSSASRSCLSKNSPSVSIFVDGGGRPCGQKCVYKGQGSRMLPVSASTLRYDDEVSKTYSSTSRPCLNKNSPSTREKSREGVKRSVRFCPVNIVIDHDSRPCRKKCAYKEQGLTLLPVSVSTTRKIGKSSSKKSEDEVKIQLMEKSEGVEDMAREFLKQYHQNPRKNNHYVDEDDDVSDSSWIF